MNERYLFRGKRVDNGEWLEGFYVGSTHDAYIINADSFSPHFESDYVKVDPATVGQCTGMRDKHGTLIFDGDVLERSSTRLFTDVKYKMAVFFSDVKGAWGVELSNRGGETFLTDYIGNAYTLEIIGNIHDNPELLEGGGRP